MLIFKIAGAGVCSREERELHINVLEMEAVQLALNAFLPRILGELVIVMSDSATVVAYVKKQEGIISRLTCILAKEIVT